MVLRSLRHPRPGTVYLKKEVSEMLRLLRREPKITPGELDLKSLPELLGKEDPVILEIGCNDGSHTLQFLSLFKWAAVYSFEPDPRAQERFKNKVTDERARLFDVALAAVDGSAGFLRQRRLSIQGVGRSDAQGLGHVGLDKKTRRCDA